MLLNVRRKLPPRHGDLDQNPLLAVPKVREVIRPKLLLVLANEFLQTLRLQY